MRSRVYGRLGGYIIGDFFRLFATKWGWAIIGLAALIGGLAWGLTSHQVAYVQGNQGAYNQGAYQMGLTNIGYIIFQQADTSNYYVLEPNKFTQEDINLTPIIDGQYSRFNFIASTDSTYVDLYDKTTGVTISYAHPIEKITFYEMDGHNPVTYTTADYSDNPNGYTINNWPYASPLMLAGALCAGIMFFFIAKDRKRLHLAKAAELAALEARPSIFARELGQGTISTPPQPYVGVNQYPQSIPGSSQYPQSLPGSETSNPYQPR